MLLVVTRRFVWQPRFLVRDRRRSDRRSLTSSRIYQLIGGLVDILGLAVSWIVEPDDGVSAIQEHQPFVIIEVRRCLLSHVHGLLSSLLLSFKFLQFLAELLFTFGLPHGHLTLEGRLELRSKVELLLLDQLLLHRLDLCHVLALFERFLELRGQIGAACELSRRSFEDDLSAYR